MENEGLSGYFRNELSAAGGCAGADERNISPLEADIMNPSVLLGDEE